MNFALYGWQFHIHNVFLLMFTAPYCSPWVNIFIGGRSPHPDLNVLFDERFLSSIVASHYHYVTYSTKHQHSSPWTYCQLNRLKSVNEPFGVKNFLLSSDYIHATGSCLFIALITYNLLERMHRDAANESLELSKSEWILAYLHGG